MEEKDRTIDLIADQEWEMFQKVRNVGGRASCQNDRLTFDIMRKSQFSIWDLPTLKSYYEDLHAADKAGRNLVMEKYAFMMENTDPEYFKTVLKDKLPNLDFECETMINEINWYLMDCERDFAGKFPKLASKGRPLSPENYTGFTSVDTYLTGELKTYSNKTLASFLELVRIKRAKGENMVLQIQEATVKAYGYADLKAAEARA